MQLLFSTDRAVYANLTCINDGVVLCVAASLTSGYLTNSSSFFHVRATHGYTSDDHNQTD